MDTLGKKYGKVNGFSRESEKSIVKIMRYPSQGTSVIFSGSCVNEEMSRSIQPLKFPLANLALPMILLKTLSCEL